LRIVSSVDVAVVGAGITGLAAAQRLPAELSVAVLEADPRPGGKVRTASLAGLPVECGPDSFLARGTSVAGLCSELGLGDRLVAAATTRAAIWSRGRARPLPEGMQAGVPSRPAALAASGILSLPGAFRAGLDLVLPASPLTESTSVAEALGRRFGREVVERLIDPLLGGIYAGDTRRLGLADALPELYALASSKRSMVLAMRGRRPTQGPGFQTLAGGLQQLTDALAASLPGLQLATEVSSLRQLPGGRYELSTAAGPVLSRAVILATPAFAAARLVAGVDARAAELLAAIPYASVATIALAYPRAQLSPTRTSGFLVPASEGRLVTAVTWLSEKWPHLGTDQVAVLRCSVGRSGDERWRDLDDARLLERVRAELAQLAGVRGEPLAGRVTRWDRAMPQYRTGHRARVAELEMRLASQPGLVLAGAAYRGVGIAACVAQAERAAEAVAGTFMREKVG
jgi:protoporphyrinogen/coproporphyrinogen III oxidase